MLTPKISGRWIGYYEYGESYPQSLQGKRTNFVLNLKETAGEFSGECIDISENNKINPAAEIKGFVNENLISFIKQYSYQLFIHDDGRREADYYNTHPEIEYTGYFDENTNKYTGEWSMVIKNILTKHDYSLVNLYSESVANDESESRMSVKEYFSSGIWEMERE